MAMVWRAVNVAGIRVMKQMREEGPMIDLIYIGITVAARV